MLPGIKIEEWRIKRNTVFIVIAISMMVAGYSVWRDMKNDESFSGMPIEKLVIEKQSGGKESFDVEVAKNPLDVEVGLMNRTSMPENHGMLFLTGEERVLGFWMKNTLISLDLVFIGKDDTIVHIAQNAEPKSLAGISSDVPAVAVIELNGGIAARAGLKEGDRVTSPSLK